MLWTPLVQVESWVPLASAVCLYSVGPWTLPATAMRLCSIGAPVPPLAWFESKVRLQPPPFHCMVRQVRLPSLLD